MRESTVWKRLDEALGQGQRVLLTSHLFPEADSIGSEVALALHLVERGKQVWIANETPPLGRYDFLARLYPVGVYEDLIQAEDQMRAAMAGNGDGGTKGLCIDTAVCLDVSSWDYIGKVGEWIRERRPTLISIDHHHLRAPFGDLDVCQEGASSAGEIVYRYLRAVDAAITPEMAEALYAAVLFDTQGLRLSNANNETVRVAGELVALGADHRRVCSELFERESLPRINLLRLALGTMKRHCDGRLAWVRIDDELFRRAGAEFADADGVLDHLLSLEDVEVCVMFRQMGSQGVKVTFRSKGDHDVGDLAEELGGGGRVHASGAQLPISLDESMERVLPLTYAMVTRVDASSSPEAAELRREAHQFSIRT